MYRIYINIIITITAVTLTIVSSINYNVDPANIYTNIKTERNLKKISNEISSSEYGVINTSNINIRDIKKALAIFS